MSGFPYNSLGQQFTLFPSYYTIGENGQPTIQTTNFMHNGPMPHLPPYLAESLSSGIDYDDPARSVLPGPGNSRSRRRVAGQGENVKFRRTRSGCYTCRNRRVKCDESRPICERCKKGNRECVYPEPPTLNKARRGSQREKDAEPSSPESSNDEFDEEELLRSSVSGSTERDTTLSLSPVQSESTVNPPGEDPNTSKNVNFSPSSSNDANILSRSRSMSAGAWDHLPEDIRFYMLYAKNNLTAHHWNYSPDGPEGLCVALLEAAPRYEPLLYAVTCFAAYHYSLGRADGKIENFLSYHSKSVISLSKALKKGEKRNLATLLTILQLATIEECLGDWVNLASHQKAAHQLLTESYTPSSIMRHSTLRNILMWYLHFDLYVGMLSGAPQIISRDWLQAQHDYYTEQLIGAPESMHNLFGEASSRSKLIGFGVLNLFGQANSGDLAESEVATKLSEYTNILGSFESDLPAAMTNPKCLVTDFTGAAARDPEDMFDPYEPGLIYGGECFPTNQLILNFLGLRVMFETRLAALTRRSPNTAFLSQTITRMAKMTNAIHYWPGSHKGSLLSFRATIALVAFLLPPGERQKKWAKKKFAAIEAQGYIYPKSIRSRTQAIWGEDESVWWLPDHNDVPPVIRQIIDFTAEPSHAQYDDKTASLREMRGIFNTFSLSDASSPDSVQSPGSSSNLRASSDQRSPADDMVDAVISAHHNSPP